MRIARDLHDVLAHRIAQINVQAGVAVHLLDKEPAKAGEAMVVVMQASKQALRELRATLGVPRQVDEAEPLTPAPGLERLHDLVADTAAGDLQVDVSVIGTPRALPAGVDLAAYRIVQESLTNVVRHARPCEALLSPSVTGRLIREFVDRVPGDRPLPDLERLTERNGR